MIVPLFLRLVVLSLTAAFVFAPALAAASPAAAGTREVSETTTREDIFVQECAGFDAVTGYSVTRDYRFVTDPNGDLVYERRHVSFSGAFANTETGRAMPYQGEFTRFADYDKGQIVIADIAVHLDLPDTGSLSYEVDLRDGDVADNPLAVLREFAAHATAAGLCDLLDGVPNVEPTGPLDLIGPASEVGQTPVPHGDLCGTQRSGTPC